MCNWWSLIQALCAQVIYQPSQASGRADQILRSAVEIQASNEDARCVQLLASSNNHVSWVMSLARCPAKHICSQLLADLD